LWRWCPQLTCPAGSRNRQAQLRARLCNTDCVPIFCIGLALLWRRTR
jgi:hypothetical protein